MEKRELLLVGSVPFLFYDLSDAARDYVKKTRPIFKDIDVIADHDVGQWFVVDVQKCKTYYPADKGKKIIGHGGQYTHCEVEVAWKDSTAKELFDLVKTHPELQYRTINSDCRLIVPHMDVLYALKMSHRFKKNTPHFLKTRSDILWLERMGAKIPAVLIDWYKRREAETYAYGHPKLNTTKAEFFGRENDGFYKYDHDSIHVALARRMFDDVPAYEHFKPNTSQVLTSRSMFESLTKKIRLRAVFEESCVLALERSQVPHPNTPVKRSFDLALEKVCTSITSGWFREYAWRHYYDVQWMYTDQPKHYKDVFDEALFAGEILPYTG